MGFTKLDERIIKSSIMAEDSDTFKIWITLLACCGPDGVADVSAPALAGICHLPMRTVEKALRKLRAPDRHSRSKECGGARIKQVEAGYFVVNYAKYRERGYSTSDAAVRMRAHRAKEAANVREHPRTSGTLSERSASASASSSASGLSSLRGKERSSKDGRSGVGGTGAPVESKREDDFVKKWGKDAVLSDEQKKGGA